MFLAGGLLLNFGWLVGTAPDAGWFGYANLTSRQFSPGPHLDFWILAIQILGISSILGALNFVVTIINMRAAGMRLLWMPVFVWMVLVTQVLVLLAFPPLTIGMILGVSWVPLHSSAGKPSARLLGPADLRAGDLAGAVSTW